jgi:hypothetical protein
MINETIKVVGRTVREIMLAKEVVDWSKTFLNVFDRGIVDPNM